MITLLAVILLAYFPLQGLYQLYRAHRRRTQIRGGHCRNCGYHLTGNVSGTCPECGTSVPRREPLRD